MTNSSNVPKSLVGRTANDLFGLYVISLPCRADMSACESQGIVVCLSLSPSVRGGYRNGKTSKFQ